MRELIRYIKIVVGLILGISGVIGIVCLFGNLVYWVNDTYGNIGMSIFLITSVSIGIGFYIWAITKSSKS